MRKNFTVGEANRVLPRLTRLIQALQDRYRWLTGQHGRGPDVQADHNIVNEGPVDAEYFRSLLVVRRLVKEAETIGVQIKDIRSGLVDFPSRLYGRDVLLCWRLGESEVGFWHDAEAGFAGRQPIPESDRGEPDGGQES